jgi:hypothetical protein
MNTKFVVKIGGSDSDVTLIETVPSLEKLIEARDVFDCHKKAYFDCYPGQDVLYIKEVNNGIVGKTVFTLAGGFIKN